MNQGKEKSVSARKKKVTLKDIGAELGLSARAVSNGLNNVGRLAPDTRKKIIETARRMGYIPNAAARSLVTCRSNFIGVLIPYLNKSFFCNIIAGLGEVAAENGFMMLLDSLDKSTRSEKERVLSLLLQHNVAGIILYPRKEDLEMASMIRSMGIPVVQVMEYMPEFGEYAVTMDNFKAACDAMEHLFSRGHSRVAFLGHTTGSAVQQERFAGYLKMMEGRKTVYQSCLMNLEDGCAAMHRIFESDPEVSAVFAASDFAALGALRAAMEQGRSIPEEFAAVGFSDVDLAANQALYPLTTIAQPKEETGRKAAQMLFGLLNKEHIESIQLPAPLVVRKSS